jgi:peroxiredoxin
MPNVKTAYRKYHDKGFEIVGFSFDEKKAWLKAINDMNLTWIHLSDLKGWGSIAAEVYEIEGIPDNLLIDPKGKIVAHDLRGEELQQALAKFIGE